MGKELHYVISRSNSDYYSDPLLSNKSSHKMPGMRFRLSHYRQESGMTQKQVADAIGISQGLYAQLESGKRRMNETYLESLADLYRIHPTQLIIDPVRDDPLYQQLDEVFRLLSPAERKILVSSAKGIVSDSPAVKTPQ